MSLYREKYIPVEPPTDGRYVVWTRSGSGEWRVAWMTGGRAWLAPDGEGEITDVLWFMDVGGINS